MKYVIKNKDTEKYFECDFAGWSWQPLEGAYKFKSLAEANSAKHWLDEDCVNSEIIELESK